MMEVRRDTHRKNGLWCNLYRKRSLTEMVKATKAENKSPTAVGLLLQDEARTKWYALLVNAVVFFGVLIASQMFPRRETVFFAGQEFPATGRIFGKDISRAKFVAGCCWLAGAGTILLPLKSYWLKYEVLPLFRSLLTNTGKLLLSTLPTTRYGFHTCLADPGGRG